MLQRLQSWTQDRLLREVVKNSGYLFSSNTAAIALSMLQGIFAARLLGAEKFGIVIVIIPFVSNVNRLLSFRMSEVVVRYTGHLLAEGKKDQAAAAIKGAALVEALTSLLAYLILLALAPLAARIIAHDPTTAPLFALYGLLLLADMVYETSTGVLQSAKRFNLLALINLGQSLITVGLIFVAFLARSGMTEVLLAYLIGKAFGGIAVSVAAFRQLGRTLDPGWWRVPLRALPGWGALIRFAISTNLQGTVNLLVRDSETILIAWLRSPTEAGYFKIALGVINLVMMPIEPFIATVYAEMAHTIARREWPATRRLLQRVSTISGVWTVGMALALALFGRWLIPLMYGGEYGPAYPALLILLVGYGFANILNWNRPLLLALGRPVFPLKVSGLVGLVKTALTLWLLPLFGYLAESAILSGYFIVSIGVIVWRGISVISHQSSVVSDQ